MPQATYGDAESLFRAAHNELMRVAYALLGNRADTEDAAQDSFVKLVTAWHRVGSLPTPDEQRAYLFRIVINEALHILRYPHRRWERLGVDTDTGGASWEALDEQVQARADLRLLWKAIGELPGMRRDVVALHAAGYEYREIAASLGVSISTVRSHISYARKQLSRTVARDWEGAQG